jgi:hypothetical protein
MAKKKSLLKLGRREATLGNQIPTRNEFHGDEGVPVKDIPLTTAIDRKELASILREPAAAALIFSELPGQPPTPIWQGKADTKIYVIGKFEKCTLRLIVGLTEEKLDLSGVTVAITVIEPKVGGLSEMKFRASYHPTTEDDLRILDHWLSRKIEMVMELGSVEELPADDQAQLPLTETPPPPGEEPTPVPPGTEPASPVALEEIAPALQALGTPDEEREKAHEREREITRQLVADREAAPPKIRRRNGREVRP